MNITRQQQLLSLIKRTISTELMDINHELFHTVVVTHVHLSNNGQECRVYVVAPDATIKLLNTNYHSEVQRRFMKRFARRTVPNIVFCPDTGDVEQLERLLAEGLK